MKLGSAFLAASLVAQPGCATLKNVLPFGLEDPTHEEFVDEDVPADPNKMTPGEIGLTIAMVASNCKFAWTEPDDVSWDDDPPLWDSNTENSDYMASDLFNFGAHRDDVQCRCSGDSFRYTCGTAIGDYEEIPGSSWRFVPLTTQYSISLFATSEGGVTGYAQMMDPSTGDVRSGFLMMDSGQEQAMMGEMAKELYVVWEWVWANLEKWEQEH